jgi:hypothetical protein
MSKDGTIVFVFFGLTLTSIAYMAKQFEIRMNWSSVKYRPEVAKYSWLWSNSENMVKDGIINAEEQITQQIVMNPVVKSLDDATNKMNAALSTVSKDVTDLKKKMDVANLYKDKKNTSFAISLQNNVLALKEGMQKVIASLIIQRHVSNDTIKMMGGTRSLQESVRVAINKVSGQAPVSQPISIEEPKLLNPIVPIVQSNKPSVNQNNKKVDKKKKKKR